MRLINYLLLFVGLFLFSACGDKLPPANEMKADLEDYNLPVVPDNKHGVVYVIRPSKGGTPGVYFDVYVDGKNKDDMIGQVGKRRYLYTTLPPGEHTIYSKAENWAEMKIQLKPKEIVFIEQVPKMGVLYVRNELRIFDEVTGKFFVMTLKPANTNEVRRIREAQYSRKIQGSIAEQSQSYKIQLKKKLNPVARVKAFREIIRFSPANEQLYDFINDLLNKELSLLMTNNSNSSRSKDVISYSCKALAASGMEKYIPTIEKAASSGVFKLQYHCSAALADYKKYYAERYKIMSKPQLPGVDVETSAYLHLLRSGNTRMIKEGAKGLIFFHQKNEVIFDVAESVLLEYGLGEKYEEKYLFAMGQLCSLLGESKSLKYQTTLEKIKNETSDFQLKRWARINLEKLK